MSTIVEALKQTKKGQLKYDCNWKEEGRTEEIVNSVKQNLATLNLSPSTKIQLALSNKSQPSSSTINSNKNGVDNNHHHETLIDSLDHLIIDDNVDDERSNDPNFSITDIELKNYEKQKKIEVIQRLEQQQRKWNEKNESMMKKYEDQMRMIQKKYLLESMRFQKKYDEEIQQLQEELDNSIRPQSISSVSANDDINNENKKRNLKLKEIEEKHRILLKEKQNELRMQINVSKEKINNSIRMFDDCLKEFPNDDDLNHQRNIAKLLEQDIESIESNNEMIVQPVINNNNADNAQENIVKNKFQSSHNIYIEYQSKLLKFENLCQQFQDNELKKPLRTALQLYVRSIINTISNISVEHLREKVSRLLNLFGQKYFEHRGKKIHISDTDYSYHFAINTAVRIILTVASKQQNISLKLAPVIIILWANVPMFGDIFLSHLYLHCPYVIPYFPTRTMNQNEIEYTIVCGYQLDKNGQLEKEETFQSRMFSLMELYSSIIQCNMPVEEHPHNIQYGWKWLAMILNDQPYDQLTALLLDAFLSMSSHKMLSIYGRQFLKLFHFIQTNFIRKIETITSKESRQTLMKFKSLLENMDEKLSQLNNNNMNVERIAKELSPNGLVPNYFFTKSYIFMSKR
ncbi:Nuclear pore complex nucleoporin component [Dermatophagoides pteronyssinus]|uniref:mRNA export factor GLE1 n=1 Tax=Dermatophagoides pteronyssinus TaxID=6956 RepID=A0ABQ8JNF9_DERPT|nr:Nuclear pore complex nucleoporin component [Dermatophagoides pteronyssinus]